LALIMGRSRLDCRFEGEEQLREWVDRGKGIILLGAHLGNWEIGGHLLARLNKPVNLVVLQLEEETVRGLFDQALQNKQFRLLTTDEHPLRSIPILAALRRGEIVALHGDRSLGRADEAMPFLGGKARFPTGPYLLAAASGAPLFQVFVVRERLGHYRFFCFPAMLVGRQLLRTGPEALQPFLTEYAQRLASMARQYPWQWYNFYPFWEASPADGTALADISQPFTNSTPARSNLMLHFVELASHVRPRLPGPTSRRARLCACDSMRLMRCGSFGTGIISIISKKPAVRLDAVSGSTTPCSSNTRRPCRSWKFA